MIEGFRKKLDCTPSHGFNPHSRISMSGNEDDGSVAFLFFQCGLQFQTGHLRHANVNNQTRSLAMQIGFQELLRGPEATCRKPRRLQKVAQGILHCFIIVDDCNQFGGFVHRHAPRVA